MDMKLFLHAQWDRVFSWVSILLGCVALWLGYLGVSDTALSHQQIPYLISGGLFGIALIAVGSTVLLSADLRDEWRKLDRLEEAIRDLTQERVGDAAEDDGRRARHLEEAGLPGRVHVGERVP